MPSSINTNFMAVHTANNLKSHYSKLSTSVERLSSGLRINSSADDAAGLAIRELMRTDIAATRQGVRNAQDAISMIQVADAALAVIDEKLIRMKELAEQAATGTYNSTQRLVIDSEFQAMGAEIDRIARSTDFNGIKLLDGSMNGEHDGSGLNSIGELKIHFGTENDSAEDYYFIKISDCTLNGLGLGKFRENNQNITGSTGNNLYAVGDNPYLNSITVNDFIRATNDRPDLDERDPQIMQDILPQGIWKIPRKNENNFMMIIPNGTKNVLINILGVGTTPGPECTGENDIALFTLNGIHLAGTPLDDTVYDRSTWHDTTKNYGTSTSLEDNCTALGFTIDDYDGSFLNTGSKTYDPSGKTLNYTRYNGMLIGYSGDPERQDTIPNDALLQNIRDYEILTIDEVTEDLILWMPGQAGALMKVYWDLSPDPSIKLPDVQEMENGTVSLTTQQKAQEALVSIDKAIIKKDEIRAHLGALQNRLENTVTNLSIQAENLQVSESRISDTDLALEMMNFVRNQVLTQSAVAMLGQANSYPHMLMKLLDR